jgi:hypothetical protein
MNNIFYIGNFSRLIRITFGDKIQGDLIIKKLPFIIYDYDEMKRQCSDVCAKFDYEYVDEHLYFAFIKKWQKKLREHNQLQYVIKPNGYNSEKYI